LNKIMRPYSERACRGAIVNFERAKSSLLGRDAAKETLDFVAQLGRGGFHRL
jgi:hypothetical protein